MDRFFVQLMLMGIMDYIIRDGAKNSIKDAYKSVPTYLDHGQTKGF